MSRSLAVLTTAEHDYLATLHRAVFMNPFCTERARVFVTLEAIPEFASHQTPLPVLDAMLTRWEAAGWTTLADYALGDLDGVRIAFLYRSYHQFLPEFDTFIAAQLAGDRDCHPVFGPALMRDICARGFTAATASEFCAFFYQLRRAYLFIVQGLPGRSRPMRQLRESLWNAIFTHDMRLYQRRLNNRLEDFSLLLIGETGTGKGECARAIGLSGFMPYDAAHNTFAVPMSALFLAVNVAQYPETLIDAELFGYVKGAFTGAMHDYNGVLKRCHRYGVLFLDEIGEINPSVQVKLLTTLQDRRFHPLGRTEPEHFHGRLLAATNRPVAELMRHEQFRRDFFYRLCADVIVLPTLRERLDSEPGELLELIRVVLGRILGQADAPLAAAVHLKLHPLSARYAWPGNVRELEQAVRRILLTGRYQPLDGAPRPPPTTDLDGLLQTQSLRADALVARYCQTLFARHGSYQEVARITGLDWRTVRKHLGSAPA